MTHCLACQSHDHHAGSPDPSCHRCATRPVYVMRDGSVLCGACVWATGVNLEERVDRRDDRRHCLGCDYHADPSCGPGSWCEDKGHEHAPRIVYPDDVTGVASGLCEDCDRVVWWDDGGDPATDFVGFVGRFCDTCGSWATTTRTEGGSTPIHTLCDSCATAFDRATATA